MARGTHLKALVKVTLDYISAATGLLVLACMHERICAGRTNNGASVIPL